MHTKQAGGFVLAEALLIITTLLVAAIIGWMLLRPVFNADLFKGVGTLFGGFSEPKSTSAPTTSPQEADSLQFTRQQALHQNLRGYALAFGSFPVASQAGWKHFLGSVRSPQDLVDPFSGKTYTFIDSLPSHGQVQYRSPGACASNNVEFASSDDVDTYAFRLLFSDGVRCTMGKR